VKHEAVKHEAVKHEAVKQRMKQRINARAAKNRAVDHEA